MVEYVIDKDPAYSILKVKLSSGESITLEPGSYMLHRGEIEVSTSSRGIMGGLMRVIGGGESFFLNTVKAKTPVEIWISPGITGDIKPVDIMGQDLIVQDSSYLAHIGDIDISIVWRGLRGLIAEGELFWIKASGKGTVFINSYGAIEQINLNPGEKLTIDNMHFVAMDSSISWRVRKFGGWKTFIFGGEGFVIDVEGPGRIWVQTRNLPVFARIISKFFKR